MWAARGAGAGAALMLFCDLVSTACAQQPLKPKLPPGRDPGGALLGLITTGIDPTLPSIARCLARDGEGELLGWDMVDRNRQPYRRAIPDVPSDEAVFASLPCNGQLRVAPVRVDPADGITLGKALAFFSTTPARVVLLSESSRPQDWAALGQAAAAFPQLVVILPADTLPPALVGASNIVAVRPSEAMAQAVKLLICQGTAAAGHAGRDPACR
jgi:hypothetical protein